MNAKHKALKHKTHENTPMRKVHSSTEYCSKCGMKTSTSTRHESGHREYEHDAPGTAGSIKIAG